MQPTQPPGVTQLTTGGVRDQGETGAMTALHVLAGVGPEDARPIDAAYLHVPFCFHKCHYCDFYSLVASDDRQAAFADRLIDELETVRPWLAGPVQSIFVGGGTPTLLSPGAWSRLLEVMADCVPLAAGGEFTVEANPETVTPELLHVLRNGGVNRLSIGAQSFHETHLKMLERHHDPTSVTRAVEMARAAGFDAISIDLIFGIPGQTADEWTRDLDAAIRLDPGHLSCYGLTYEPNTALTARLRAGQVTRMEEDDEARLYELTMDRLGRAGFEQYEISNWARPGARCRHNLVYWTNGTWWPFGPSAAGHVAGRRWKNAPHLGAYLESRGLPPVTDVERLDDDGRAGEALMLGLRLTDGISRDCLAALLALGRRGDERRVAIDRHAAAGRLVLDADGVRLSRKGRLLGDLVLADLV